MKNKRGTQNECKFDFKITKVALEEFSVFLQIHHIFHYIRLGYVAAKIINKCLQIFELHN